MDCKKKFGQARAEQINYLFKGFYNDNNEYEGTLKPLPYVSFAAKTLLPENTKDCVNPKLSETIEPWCSNHIGAINPLLPDMNNGHRIRMLTSENKIKAQELYFPYPEDFSYLCAAKGKNWTDTLKNGFQTHEMDCKLNSLFYFNS